MDRVIANLGLIGAAWSGLLIVAAVAMLVAYRWRRQHQHPAPWRDSLAEAAIVVGTLPWLILMFWHGFHKRAFQLVPLRDLAAQLAGDPIAAFMQISANLVVFVPLGFLGSIRWPALRSVWLVALIGFGGSALVETLQYLLDLGRVSSVDDVLLNGGGMVLAALASCRWWRPRADRG